MLLLRPITPECLYWYHLFVLIWILGHCGTISGDTTALGEPCQQKTDCQELQQENLGNLQVFGRKLYNSSSAITAPAVFTNLDVPAKESEVERNDAKSNSSSSLLTDIKTSQDNAKLRNKTENQSRPTNPSDLSKVVYWNSSDFKGDELKSHPGIKLLIHNTSQIPNPVKLIAGKIFETGGNVGRPPPSFYFILPHGNIRNDLGSNDKLNAQDVANSSLSQHENNYQHPYFVRTVPSQTVYSDFTNNKLRNRPEIHYTSHADYKQNFYDSFNHNNERSHEVIINHPTSKTQEQDSGVHHHFFGGQPELKLTHEPQNTQAPEAGVPYNGNQIIYVPLRLNLHHQSDIPQSHQSVRGLNYIIHDNSQKYQSQSDSDSPYERYYSMQYGNNFGEKNTQSLPETKVLFENQVSFVGPITLHPSETQDETPVINRFFHKYENQDKLTFDETGMSQDQDTKLHFIVHRSGLLPKHIPENTVGQHSSNDTNAEAASSVEKSLHHLPSPKQKSTNTVNNSDQAGQFRKTKRSILSSEIVTSSDEKSDKNGTFLDSHFEEHGKLPEAWGQRNESSSPSPIEFSGVEYVLFNASSVTYLRNESMDEEYSKDKDHNGSHTEIPITHFEANGSKVEEEPFYSQALSAHYAPNINDSTDYKSYGIWSSGVDSGDLNDDVLFGNGETLQNHSEIFSGLQGVLSVLQSEAAEGNKEASVNESDIPTVYSYSHFNSATTKPLTLNSIGNYNGLKFVSVPPTEKPALALFESKVYRDNDVDTTLVATPNGGYTDAHARKSPTFVRVYNRRPHPKTGVFRAKANPPISSTSYKYLGPPKSENFEMQSKHYLTEATPFDTTSNLLETVINQYEHVPVSNTGSYRHNSPRSYIENVPVNSNRKILPTRTNYFVEEETLLERSKEIPFTLSLGNEAPDHFAKAPSSRAAYVSHHHQGVDPSRNPRRHPSSYSYTTQHDPPQQFTFRLGGRSANEVSIPIRPLANFGLNVVRTILPAINPLQNLRGRLVVGMELSNGFGSNSGYRISPHRPPIEPHGYAWNRR